jgi:hypothetical protein
MAFQMLEVMLEVPFQEWAGLPIIQLTKVALMQAKDVLLGAKLQIMLMMLGKIVVIEVTFLLEKAHLLEST